MMRRILIDYAEALGISEATVEREWSTAALVAASHRRRGTGGMSTERWPQIKEILQSALERSPDQRAQFVRQACKGDVELQREVEA